MSTTSESASLFEAVTGLLVFVPFLTAAFCIVSLRSHVDEAKIRKEDSISSMFRSTIPPEHVLTAAGVHRVKIAKVSIAVCFVTVAVLVVKNLMLNG